jgi:murein DD-endopeptidase MepM/ murein hydrolase activator NlpD
MRSARTLVALLLLGASAGLRAHAPVLQASDVETATVTLQARSQRPGELVVVNVTLGGEVGSVTLLAFDRAISAYRTAPRRWQALVGLDLDQAPGNYPVSVQSADGRVLGETTLMVVPRQFPTRTLRVNPDFVNPPESLLARIDEESRFTQLLYANPAAERLWSGSFVRPVPHQANSRFGTRSVFNGEPRNAHAGTDFLSPAGTPIRAPNAGRVVAARDLFFSGGTVILDHGLGLFSQFAHLSRIDVTEGEMVKAGQVVGRVGATGRVTGAHLHWGLRVSGARVDPLSLLALMGKAASP